MKSTIVTPTLAAFAFVALTPSLSHAAKKAKPAPTPAAKKEEPPPPPPPPPPPAREEAPPPPPADVEAPSAGGQTKTDSNRPADFGTGYYSWGTRGGATLGQGNGARANLFFGSANLAGGGLAGAEGYYILNLGENFDLGVGARLPFWPIGLSPTGQARYRVMGNGKFQLAIDASISIPMYFVGFFGTGFNLGLSLEPGAMMSYFIKDNMELYFGMVVPIGFLFVNVPGVFWAITFDARVGFAYTLKKSNIGFFGGFGLGPAISNGAAVLIPGFGPFVYFNFNFTAGAQFRF